MDRGVVAGAVARGAGGADGGWAAGAAGAVWGDG